MDKGEIEVVDMDYARCDMIWIDCVEWERSEIKDQ